MYLRKGRRSRRKSTLRLGTRRKRCSPPRRNLWPANTNHGIIGIMFASRGAAVRAKLRTRHATSSCTPAAEWVPRAARLVGQKTARRIIQRDVADHHRGVSA